MNASAENNPARRSILEERPLRIPVAGKIRAGIKVLTRTAAANAKAAQIYADGVRAGESFDAIGKRIEAQCDLRNPLTPRNTPYFRVSRCDFHNPATADRILELYGEDRGDGPHLYRFPAVFAFDDWLQNLPHGLRSFTRSGLRYWSEYDATGRRFCMQHAMPDVKHERAARAWGGRRIVLREENGGACNPESCAQYQKRECTMSGRLLFYIPGIPGSSLIELDTTSIYSMQQMRAQLELVAGLRAGRLSGTHMGAPIFHVQKVQSEVTMLEAGQPKKTKQFLVNLEADITMVDIMNMADRALVDGRRAAAALAGPTVSPAPAPESAPPADAASASPIAGAPEPGPAAEPDLAQLTREIRALLDSKGKPENEFSAAMTAKYGRGWSKNAATMAQIKKDMEYKPV